MINVGTRRLHRVFLSGKASGRFAIGVVLGLSFSISVILATIGIMDGFEESLRRGLKKTVGELIIHSGHGFFSIDQQFAEMKKKYEIDAFSPSVQVEAFIISNERSKGVLINGVDFNSFKKVTTIHLNLKKNEVAIGKELAKYFDLKIGDEVVLAFANGNRNFEGLPRLERVRIGQIVTHGVYLKDIRLIYFNLENLQHLLDLDQKINAISLNVPLAFKQMHPQQSIRRFKYEIEEFLDLQYGVRPYWQDFAGLIEAVKIQKFVIALILQLIVVISIFNLFAFLIFLNEKKAKDIFLFRSLGMSQRRLVQAWLFLLSMIWGVSCLVATGFVYIFDLALAKLPIFKLPGDIYHLGQLSIDLDLGDFALVFSLALFWILVISIYVLWRLRKKSILAGLRKEFA